MARLAFVLSAALVTSTAPAVAADDLRVHLNPERRSGVFAGASFSVPFNGPRAGATEARLQLTMMHRIEDRASASPTRRLQSDGFSLGLTRTGQPRFSINGQTMPDLQRRLGFRGATTPLIIGGVVVLGIGAFLLFHDCEACDGGPAN